MRRRWAALAAVLALAAMALWIYGSGGRLGEPAVPALAPAAGPGDGGGPPGAYRKSGPPGARARPWRLLRLPGPGGDWDGLDTRFLAAPAGAHPAAQAGGGPDAPWTGEVRPGEGSRGQEAAGARGLRPGGGPVPVPILMYHEIAPGPNNLYVPPAELAAHLAWLASHGYQTVTLRQVYDHFTRGEPLPPRPVVLTFDDGYASFYTAAFPLLQRHGFTATLFVVTGLVGRPNYVTWDQVVEVDRAGIEVASHTVSHPDLTRLDGDRLRQELAGSRQELEQRLGHPVLFFAYPGGHLDDRVVAAVRQAGYLAAVTTRPGPATAAQDPYRLHRLRVLQRLSPEGLGRLLASAQREH